MTGKQAVLERLRQDVPGPRTIEERLEEQKQAWLVDLRELMVRIDTWLAEGKAEGLFKVELRQIEVAEEDLGPYEAPALTILVRTTHPRTIKVEPKGMAIVGFSGPAGKRLAGARGRVDLMGGASRVRLFRGKDAGSWKIVTPEGDAADLTEDLFFEALDELIE